MILSITEYFITKIERTVFSMLFGSAVFLSIVGIVTDNYEILKAVDSMDLSKNKREVEIVKDYSEIHQTKLQISI